MAADIQTRPATLADLPNVARIHVRSWQQAYAGQLPQDYLDQLDASSRLKIWETIIQDNATTGRGLQVAHLNGEAVGFVSFGPARGDFRPGYGEIYAIYLLQEAWGRGVGHTLFQVATQTLAEKGYAQMYAWVLASNQLAIDAYSRWGGTQDMAFICDDTIGGMPVKEHMMVFTLPATAGQTQ